MRFLEERTVLAKENGNLASAYLFFGCRNPDHDFLYRKQVEQWDEEVLVHFDQLFPAMNQRIADA